MRKTVAVLIVFILYQSHVVQRGMPPNEIKRGQFTTLSGCMASARSWAETLEMGDKEVHTLNDGYVVVPVRKERAGSYPRPTGSGIQLQCR